MTIKLLFVSFVTLMVIFLGRQLIPNQSSMFDFHDATQGARIEEFALNLRYLKIPPRIAPHFSQEMGYPVFNFYAPFSYWIGSILHIAGFDIPDAIKLSFLLALITSFTGMFLYLRQFFAEYPALLGGLLYSASPYVAVEIFVRGNLAEMWFIALFPLALFLLHLNLVSRSKRIFFLTACVLSFAFTAHTIFSLVFIVIAFAYILLLRTPKKNLLAMASGLLLSSYFLLPFFAEQHLTWAKEIATATRYSDHFLCWWQLWTARLWGYGGSAPGCHADGLSFMIGKAQIVLGAAGVAYFLHQLYRRRIRKHLPIFIFVCILSLGSIFLTTYSAEAVWNAFSPLLSVFQFPWRLSIFGLFGLSFFAAYGTSKSSYPALPLVLSILAVALLVHSSKYFTKPTISKMEYSQRFLSKAFVTTDAALAIPEYLPRTADFRVWKSFLQTKKSARELSPDSEPTPFEKKFRTADPFFTVPIHYFPNWRISVDDEEYSPKKFDTLGRPVLTTSAGVHTIRVTYRQTPVQILGNFLTLASALTLAVLLVSKHSWKKLYRKEI